jgi:large subunit ribosomal protein L15
MKLHELKRNSGSTKKRKIVGRGPGSGLGKTSGRGSKGQLSRSGGGKVHQWFEGGQTPLFKTIPRRGFNNKRFAKRYAIVNVEDLNRFKDGTIVTPELLKTEKIIKKELNGVKVLGSGKLERKLTVKANLFTNTAINKIEELGGKAEVI